jgi:hypothetical protein
MRSVAVLSHLMSENCILSDESIARAQYAIKIYSKFKCKFIITSGWAYREGCSVPISDVFAEYILLNSNIASDRIISIPLSRDTVGDAFFIRRLLKERNLKELLVVTSDYHVKRAGVIFKKVFCNSMKISVYGAQSGRLNDVAALTHEGESTKAFECTFVDEDFQSEASLIQVLKTKHPFYNGEIHSKLGFDAKT